MSGKMAEYRPDVETISAVKIKHVCRPAGVEGAELVPESLGSPPILVDSAWFNRHRPEGEGYYAKCGASTDFWLPAEVFERLFQPNDVPVAPTKAAETETLPPRTGTFETTGMQIDWSGKISETPTTTK